MEAYLLKSSLALAVLYILYRALLSRETNHQLKRFLGFACILFSVAFLLLPVGSFFVTEFVPETTSFTLPVDILSSLTFSETAIPENSYSPFSIIYLVGVGFFSLRFLVGIFTLLNYYLKSEKHNRWGFKVATVNKEISPFTFFNILFIGKKGIEEAESASIITHEQFHRDQYHSIDSLLLEFLTIAFWFNPVVWLFRKDIKAEHEYMADKQVLKNGISSLDYQHLLVATSMGITVPIGNHLNSSTNLTKRIKMMTNNKINLKNGYLKAALFLPLMGIILACSTFLESEPTIVQSESGMPLFIVDGKEVSSLEGINPNDIKSWTALSGEGELDYNMLKSFTSTLPVLDPSENMSSKNGQEILPPPPPPPMLTNIKAGAATEKYGNKAINGAVEITLKNKTSQNSKKILPPPPPPPMLTNIKAGAATEKYGNKAINGAVEITLKNKTNQNSKIDPSVIIRGTSDKNPLYVVDGVLAEDNETIESLNSMDPNKIESITVLKGEKASDKYGAKAQNGVVEIILK